MFRGRVRHVHFIGVGGIGMSGLAEILRTLEFDVSGSDLREGENTRNLQRLGVRIQLDVEIDNREEALDLGRSPRSLRLASGPGGPVFFLPAHPSLCLPLTGPSAPSSSRRAPTAAPP